MTYHEGMQLGNYRLIHQLGKGGFAVVYLGEHIHLKTQAAIKVLHQVQLSNEEVEKFRQEAITIANLRHSHIIEVLDYGIQESTSTPFLVMEYAPGTMRQHYPRGTRLTPHNVLPYLEQVASALKYAHKHKVIHRDVKPENMLLDKENRVKLSDFGIAVVDETSRAAHAQDRLGTPPYMAPEQFRGQSLPASDQYALGIVVYEWLCGTRPFTGELPELLLQHERALPPPMHEKVPSLSPAIETVVLKALAKNPQERYKRVSEFAEAFKAACQQMENSSQRTISVPSRISYSPSSPPVMKGRIKPVTVTPPEDSSVIWNVPYRRNTFFTGRSQVLTLLHDNFRQGKEANRTQALSGLGGIGKTQIAIEYVYRYHSDYEVILWLRGDTKEKMHADMATVAALLNLKERSNLTEALRAWLRTHTKWLLVIDNIEDLKLIEALLPASPQGHILLTTRNQTTGNIAQCIDLEKMTPEEGTLFLLRRTKLLAQDATLQDALPVDLRGAQNISEVLGGLPLALDQAGAYIEETGCNLSNYLESFQTGRKKLLNRRGGFDFEHPASVAATFSSSFDKIEKASAAAAELLRLCTFLHPDSIPVELIISGASELGPVLQPVASDPLLLDATIAILRRYSLVRRHSGTNALSLHPLVQAVFQDAMNEKAQRLWVERTVQTLHQALPDIKEYDKWSRCQKYMPHVQKCVDLVGHWKIVSQEAARLIEQTGIYLQVQTHLTQASALFEQASDMQALLGKTETQGMVAFLIHHFWHCYYQGQFTLAEQPAKKALKLLQQNPGSHQQTIASCQGAVAYLFYQQGHFNQAEEHFLQALAIYESHVGLAHPSVVCTFSGLGNLSLALAKYDLAERFFWDSLTTWQKTPEPQHPLFCLTINGLARLSLARGAYAQAERYLEQERAHMEQTLHPFHPALANNMNELALLYIAQGKYHQVKPLLKQGLAILEQSVGLQHPLAGSIFDTLGQLSYLRGKYIQNKYIQSARYSAAEKFFQRAHNIREQALGVEHPDLLSTVHHLGDVYAAQALGTQGKSSMARELYSDVLALRTRILGADHPAVAQTLDSMAQLSYDCGQYIEAEQMYKQALAIQEKMLGTEHPDVARSLYGLAILYCWKWKRPDLAETRLLRALAIYEKVPMPEHPEMMQMFSTYASLLWILKRQPEATEAKARVKTILEKQTFLLSDEQDEETW